MTHYISVEFLSSFRMSSPPGQTQSFPVENFLAMVLHWFQGCCQCSPWACSMSTSKFCNIKVSGGSCRK